MSIYETDHPALRQAFSVQSNMIAVQDRKLKKLAHENYLQSNLIALGFRILRISNTCMSIYETDHPASRQAFSVQSNMIAVQARKLEN
jgi:hypothetical protein